METTPPPYVLHTPPTPSTPNALGNNPQVGLMGNHLGNNLMEAFNGADASQTPLGQEGVAPLVVSTPGAPMKDVNHSFGRPDCFDRPVCRKLFPSGSKR